MNGLTRACFFVLLLLLIDGGTTQLVMDTPSITASIGDTVVFSARSTILVSTNLVNWYALGTAVTSNGVLSGSSIKYSIFNNGTLFKLTIISLSSTDFGSYTLLYLNVPSAFASVNATLTQYILTTGQ
jgi:hypothetical protein